MHQGIAGVLYIEKVTGLIGYRSMYYVVRTKRRLYISPTLPEKRRAVGALRFSDTKLYLCLPGSLLLCRTPIS